MCLDSEVQCVYVVGKCNVAGYDNEKLGKWINGTWGERGVMGAGPFHLKHVIFLKGKTTP